MNSMNNYAVLLEQFHIYQQQQKATHQQFAQLIDQVRNEKQAKQLLIARKKEERGKLVYRLQRGQLTPSVRAPRTDSSRAHWQDQFNLQEINNAILRKESEELEKEVHHIRKVTKEMEDRLAVFIRKDNDIKQLKYSCRREMENAELEVRNQKLANSRQEQKYDRLLEQLNVQKSNLEHENRFLADQLNLTRCFMKTLTRPAYFLDKPPETKSTYKLDQLYTKREILQNFRCLYTIYVQKKKWDGSTNNQISQGIESEEFFNFLSKQQIFEYFIGKLKIKSIHEIVAMILQFYGRITVIISKNQNRNSYLNTKLTELKQEYKKLCHVFQALQEDQTKNTQIMIEENDRQIGHQIEQIKKLCTTILQIIDWQYRLADRIRRILNTLESIIEPKPDNRPLSKISNMCSSSQFRKNFCIDKRSSMAFGSSKNISNEITCQKGLPTNKCIQINGKKSQKKIKFPFARNENLLFQYESILQRNPKEIIFKWSEAVKDKQSGIHFLESILNNDLFRAIEDPACYDPEADELDNQHLSSVRVYQKAQMLLKCLQQSISQNICDILKVSQELERKNAGSGERCVPSSQIRYVIESKGYFRRDNFKLLEKLEAMEQKKQGLYIPFSFGVEVEQELAERNQKQLKIQMLDRSQILALRRPRNTAPGGSNYLSSYRQRVNKADKKIRDLFNDADKVRIRKKLSTNQNNSCMSPQSSHSRHARRVGQSFMLK